MGSNLRAKLVDVTLVADTNIYASGDVLVDTQIVSNALADINVPGILDSLCVIDEDDQKAAFDIHFFASLAALGTINGAPSITDAAARNWLGFVPIATGDYKDLGGVSVANIKNIGLLLKPATDTKDIYLGVINGTGTPTYTASGLKLRLGIQS